MKKHKVWNRHGKNIRLYREGNLYNAYMRTGDVTQELAPVEPADESWTRMEVDDGQRDKQEESEDQPEELRRVLEARQPTELERQKHSQMNHAVLAPCCEVCVKAKGTGAQHRRQTNKELAKQEQYGPRIYSDFFYISEEGVSTPMLALRFSRSGRMAATALEQKGLTQCGVTFFAGFIQQTGVRMFINKSDGSQAPKVVYTDNSMEFGKACEVLSWSHRMSSLHRSETNGIAERAVRRVKECTSAVLPQSGQDERWWSDSMECYCSRPPDRCENAIRKTIWRTI